MSLDVERLYKLLPAVYRIRDSELGKQLLMSKDRARGKAQIVQLEAELKSLTDKEEEKARKIRKRLDELQRGPLKALIDIIAEQARVMEVDIDQMYENWFIETCAEWVIPYIGDLLAVRGLHSVRTAAGFSRRARVANTLRYRRRKGTAAVLEQLAYDTTGWRARVVEFFELLGTTQNYNHIRRHNLRTPDLRRTNELELLDTAFDTIAHTVDVRSIAIGRGRHNIPNIGLFLWRLQSYPMIRATARAAKGKPAGCYTFSPLGHDMSLFNRPQTETEITHLAEEINVPGLLRRRPLYDELEALRQALVDGRTPEYMYFDDRPNTKAQPVLEVFLNGSSTPVLPKEVFICNLEDWKLPPDKKKYKRSNTVEYVDRPIKVAVDPFLGRLTFPSTASVKQVQVSFTYGFSGDVGGGPYNRQESISSILTRKVTWQVGVSKEIPEVPGEIFNSLADAVKEWNEQEQPDGAVGVITIFDNQTYEENLTGTRQIKIKEGSQLLIVAADWPEVDVPGGFKHRIIGQLIPNGRRPHILGDLKVKGTAAETSLNGGELVLDGLLIEGKISVLAGNLGGLRISHSTLVPGQNGLEVRSKNDRLKIDLIRSICGPIRLTPAIAKLHIEESIVDNRNGKTIKARLTAVELQKSTIFGSICALNIEAGNCIFVGMVDAERQQISCIRFSYVPINSNTPRRFRCQPDLERSTQILKAEEQDTLSSQERKAIRKRILEWLVPAFTSIQYGHHAYAQLSQTCPSLIREGAEDGSEMGVFSFLKKPQRGANIKVALDEYLRLGLEAGFIYVT